MRQQRRKTSLVGATGWSSNATGRASLEDTPVTDLATITRPASAGTIPATATPAVTALIDGLADLFASEGRPGGDMAAQALRTNRLGTAVNPGTDTVLGPQVRQIAVLPGALPLARLVLEAWDALPWHHSGLEDGRIPREWALRMTTAEVLGPRGIIDCDSCRVGLFAQIPGVDYPERRHAAEETFFTLAGEGDWCLPPEDWRHLGPGEHSFHPSWAAHRSRTTATGFLTAWRWTGDTRIETYALKSPS